ncbi:PA3496 family putative envelope integrity protein [Vibrio hippocampi]|uniref:Uncharacterized protein n=1 Tax=Vibrio hippocampi TaxID=654686 RepID=A0ABN8DLU3_9VIBR|nr:hypothetical protein [Vibrio hippocampi]CAH0530450.1 hypothetical protein VHP8226_04073 [Vibrio hippocampi]
MSINSIDHDEMTAIKTKWDNADDIKEESRPSSQTKSVQARRRIEALREIRESGLTIEEAKDLGLIH